MSLGQCGWYGTREGVQPCWARCMASGRRLGAGQPEKDWERVAAGRLGGLHSPGPPPQPHTTASTQKLALGSTATPQALPTPTLQEMVFSGMVHPPSLTYWQLQGLLGSLQPEQKWRGEGWGAGAGCLGEDQFPEVAGLGLDPGSAIKNCATWASLVAQWLRIHLPMQGTRVLALVREDPTCRRATKAVHRNY